MDKAQRKCNLSKWPSINFIKYSWNLVLVKFYSKKMLKFLEIAIATAAVTASSA